MSNELTFKHILVGVEESEFAKKAFEYAVYRACKEQSKLTLALIIEEEDINTFEIMSKDFIKKAQNQLIIQAKEYRKYALSKGVEEVEVLIGQGKPGEVIVKEFIPQSNADLLIIGAKSKKGFSDYLGTQASYMAKNAPISVLVIR